MRLPLDPPLRLRAFGYLVTGRASSLVILAVVIGGVLSRLSATDDHHVGLVRTVAAGTIVLALLIAVLLIHEIVRLSAARRFGATAARVELHLFGGIGDAGWGGATPRTDTFIGLIAYSALLGCAGGVAMAVWLTREARPPVPAAGQTFLITTLAVTVLQAMPGFPLDGGRIFRAWIWHLTDDPNTALRAAALYSQFIAVAMMPLGVAMLTRSASWPYWGLWTIAAGADLGTTTRDVVRRAHWQHDHRGITVGQAARAAGRTLSGSATIDSVVEQLHEAGPDIPFLVTGQDGHPLGVLRLTNLRRTRRTSWGERTTSDVVTPLIAFPCLEGDRAVLDAVDQMDSSGVEIALVSQDGEPAAVISRTQLLAHAAPHSNVSDGASSS